jgi:hypothetical protein
MAGQAPSSQGGVSPDALDLVGQWRARLQLRSGDFAAVDDLEFMYVFNTGGTMTESSNYDAAPPVPPAYGIWRRIGPDRFEAKYEFYPTSAPTGLEDITKGSGWLPAGRGVFSETITVAADARPSHRRSATRPLMKPASRSREAATGPGGASGCGSDTRRIASGLAGAWVGRDWHERGDERVEV